MSDSESSDSDGERQVVVMGINITQFNKPDYSNPLVLEHQRSFEEWLFTKYTKKGTSSVLTYLEVEDIRKVLNVINFIKCY